MLYTRQIQSFIKKEACTFTFAFACLCLAFAPLLLNFVWGNHDWLPIIQDSRITHGLIEGRFSQYILLNLLLNGKILPVFNIVIGFFLYALALMLLCRKFYDFDAPRFITTVILCAVATLPFLAEILYFHYITLSLLSWPLIVVAALMACRQASLSRPVFFTFLGTLLLFFAVGGYPPVINMFAVAAVGRMILDYGQGSIPFRTVCRNAAPYLISLFFSLLALMVVFFYLHKTHRMLNLYNSQAASLAELFTTLPQTLHKALLDFITPQPFLSLKFKYLTSAICLFFCIIFVRNSRSAGHLFFRLLMLTALLLSTKLSAWLTSETADSAFAAVDPTAYMVRISFYSFPALLLLCFIYLYQTSNALNKNMVFLSAFILLAANISLSLSFSKTHLFGFTAENKLLERIISRIQEHPDFNPQNLYTATPAGELPLRRKYYTAGTKEKYGYYTLDTPYVRHWIAFEYFNFYAPKNFIREGTAIEPHHITKSMADFLTSRIAVWPSENSIYVNGNHAIIALSPEGKQLLTGQFSHINPYLTGNNP